MNRSLPSKSLIFSSTKNTMNEVKLFVHDSQRRHGSYVSGLNSFRTGTEVLKRCIMINNERRRFIDVEIGWFVSGMGIYF